MLSRRAGLLGVEQAVVDRVGVEGAGRTAGIARDRAGEFPAERAVQDLGRVAEARVEEQRAPPEAPRLRLRGEHERAREAAPAGARLAPSA